jgi:GAF domain-containing protein
MTGGRPDVLGRLDRAATAIASVDALLMVEGSMADVLDEVARHALSGVTNADAVSITLIDDPAGRTVACTDDLASTLDHEQYVHRRGPCLEAARTQQPVRVSTGNVDARWPQFVDAARDAGVRSTLSVPLIVTSATSEGDDELVGSLNAYSRSAVTFDEFDEKLLSLYTGVAGRVIADTRRWQRVMETVGQLERALHSRAEIDQAKGVLRTLYGGTADEAFAGLVQRSQRENVKLREIARRILEELPQRFTGNPVP